MPQAEFLREPRRHRERGAGAGVDQEAVGPAAVEHHVDAGLVVVQRQRHVGPAVGMNVLRGENPQPPAVAVTISSRSRRPAERGIGGISDHGLAAPPVTACHRTAGSRRRSATSAGPGGGPGRSIRTRLPRQVDAHVEIPQRVGADARGTGPESDERRLERVAIESHRPAEQHHVEREGRRRGSLPSRWRGRRGR